MKNKICSNSKCLQPEKPLSEFGKDSRHKDGLQSQCKECNKEYKKEFYENFPWKQIFNNINSRCNNPKSINYKWYGKKGIKNYLTEEDIKFLWFRDKAYLMSKPSIDRKKSNKNYTLENCRFIELKDNVIKGNKESHIKPILQYDLKDNFIREFKSIIEVERILGLNHSHISECARGKLKTSGSFKWIFKNKGNKPCLKEINNYLLKINQLL